MNMNELADEIGKMSPEQLVELATIIADKAKQPTPKPAPTIFERLPVGSYICGLRVVRHDADDTTAPIKFTRNGCDFWTVRDVVDILIACHDWILKYYPVIEAAREWSIATSHPNSSHFGSIYAKFAVNLEKAGLWKNIDPVKMPWEDSE